ncbi:MAG TPA: flotillin family protein [Myxococcales bacterium]|nr:flotillin family protein [Deltaproteobacteria bacterium]HAA56227.1 flotillin family protein [Myxococcales bacterium]|tara:strand:- start:10732 stop:11976 length:1245 start_codon:yes stop_codon:yes gene_type:complete
MTPDVLIIVAFILGLVGITSILVVKNLLYICQPNEVLIFTGSKRKVGDEVLGYRIVKGGRAVRMPLIEQVDYLDLTNMVLDLSIRNAYSKGGIPLNVDAVANVKIAGTEPVINHAIGRLLGKTREEVMRIAKETLEGNLRGVLSTLTPEEVNEDKAAFQKSLVGEAEQDLKRLGIQLDTFNIQNISDDRGYLDSIGRKQSAEVQKRALVAEAETKATASIRKAENNREVSLAQIRAERDTVKAEADRRIIDATTRRAAVVAEERSQIAAMIAKATAEQDVQRARIEQVRRKLEADVIEPSRANMQAAIADAVGKAAKIVEDGHATAEALRAVTETWAQAGSNARDIFLLQKMDVLVKLVLETVADLEIEQVTVLPDSSGGSNNLAGNLVSTSEQIKAALGVDLPQIVQSFSKSE